MNKNTVFKFSEEDIIKNLKKIDGWFLKEDLTSISKTFIFKDFKVAFSWMTSISIEAEKLNHHPEWSNVYNKVEVNLYDNNGVFEHLTLHVYNMIDLSNNNNNYTC